MSKSNEYTQLIAGYHAKKERFQEWIYALTEPLRIAQERLVEMQTIDFDLDAAVGSQLDAVGQRIGLGRNLPVPITDAFFALDDVDGIGLDFGIWFTKLDSLTSVVVMSDGIYRMALKAKVRLNHFDGTRAEIVDVISDLFDAFDARGSLVRVSDGQDMTFTIAMDEGSMNPVLLGLIRTRVLDAIAAGVGPNFVDTAQVRFGFDLNSIAVKGFDLGYWGNS
jgi:hypothetical protein